MDRDGGILPGIHLGAPAARFVVACLLWRIRVK
jgi:hypothetical protein